MVLNNCFTQSPTNNLLFPGCCCRLVCSLVRTSGEPNKLINSIAISGGTATIISIEGTPYTGPTNPPLPISLVGTTPILVEIEVCGTTIGNLFNAILSVTWSNFGGGSQNFTLPFLTVNPASYYTPLGPLLSFGVVPFGSSASQTINLTNPTKCPIIYIHNNNCANPELTINQPTPFIIPANTTVPFTATWSPTISGDNSLDCDLNIYTFCDIVQTLIFTKEIEGIAAEFSSCLQCIDVAIETESNYLPTKVIICPIDPSIEKFTLSAIGEKKKIIYQFAYTPGIASGFQLWFNPWAFDFLCNFGSKYGSGFVDSAPPFAWFVVYDGTLVPQTMTLIGTGAAANSQKNLIARFVPIDSFTFYVEFNLFLIENLDNWVNGTLLQNQPKLLRNHVANPTPLDNSVQSVYNIDKQLCALFFIQDPYIQIPDPLGGPSSVDFTCYEIKGFGFSSRFYNRGLYDGPSEFTNPDFTLLRAATNVTNFSTITPTEIEFKIDTPFGSAPNNIIFHLIDAQNTNDLVDFLTNYDSSRANITTIPGTAVINNHLWSPSVGPQLVGGSTYQAKAHVNTSISPSGQFYIIAIVYDASKEMVNSFISGPITVTSIPGPESCCSLKFTSVWEDYLHAALNVTCVRPTMKERLKHIVRGVGNVTFPTCFPEIDGDVVGSYLKDITVNVYRVANDFPVLGQSTYFIFDKYQSIRVVGFPGNWNNLTPGFVVSDSGTVGFQSELDFRVRYEDNLIPSQVFVSSNLTPYNRNNVGPLALPYATANSINYDWAEQEIFFEYQVKIDLSTVFGFPCEFVNVYFGQIVPHDFEPIVNSWLSAIEMFYLDEFGNPDLANPVLGPICTNAADAIAVRVTKSIPDEFAFFAFIDGPNNYTVSNLFEEESFSSNAPIPLPTNTTPKLYGVDLLFGIDNVAFYKIDLTTLSPGKYQICGMAKKLIEGEKLRPTITGFGPFFP